MKWNIQIAIPATLILVTVAIADPVVINSGNVIGRTIEGEVPHHLLQTQHDFAKLVALETNGEVDLRILEGKRADIPVFTMPKMTREGSVIQACAVPSFFLPMVSDYKIFEIPYLFRDRAHAAGFPTSKLAGDLAAQVEERYQVKVLGHFLVAHTVGITSTNRPIVSPMDFADRHVNDGFESFEPMWVNIKPAQRYDIGFTEALAGALHREEALDTSIGMLQNSYVQKQYTKFNYVTVAPSFYTFFYVFMMNQDVWNGLSEAQQAGVMRAAQTMQVAAFDNERATAIYHTALNKALGVNVHVQTGVERRAWADEFSDKVRDGILEQSDRADELQDYLRMIEEM